MIPWATLNSFMIRIAAIYTCYNRKEKTLAALTSLYEAFDSYNLQKVSLSIYLTDDGSTDGTSAAIKSAFPKVKLLKGSGLLFWSKGMHLAWSEAQKTNYDFYFLLNDDTFVYPFLLEQIFSTHDYSKTKFGKSGIYVGGTENKETGVVTYCGGVVRKTLIFSKRMLHPSGKPQVCDLGTANIMAISNETVNKMGIIDNSYPHGFGDYDYTLRARKAGIPVLIVPKICGHCENDHIDPIPSFLSKTYRQRLDYLYKPAGLNLKSHLLFVKRFFPMRAPFVWINGHLKVLFPRIYLKTKSWLN